MCFFRIFAPGYLTINIYAIYKLLTGGQIHECHHNGLTGEEKVKSKLWLVNQT